MDKKETSIVLENFLNSPIESLIDTRVKNYIKAINYCQKYDQTNVTTLLEKAESLKRIQNQVKDGQDIDR